MHLKAGNTLQLSPVNYHKLVTSILYVIESQRCGGGGVHFKPQ